MAYQIDYAYTCHTGKVRTNNEDNFWCCGDSLEAQNQGMSHIRSGYMKQSEYPLQSRGSKEITTISADIWIMQWNVLSMPHCASMATRLKS